MVGKLESNAKLNSKLRLKLKLKLSLAISNMSWAKLDLTYWTFAEFPFNYLLLEVEHTFT